jgi:hypothetical protein
MKGAKGAAVKSRLGFLSGTGAVVSVAVLAGLAVWTLIGGPVLFSPGALNAKAKARTLGGVASHAQLSADCGACHPAPWSSRSMADQCLACHTDVGAQIQSRTGVHGAMLAALSAPTCRGCHTEHRGTTAALTVIDASAFPHDLTGYSLRGHSRTAKGTRFACADCHPKGLATFDTATCADCHAGIDAAFMSRHEASFGRACLVCHNGSGAGAGDFDHNRLAFKLTGKHAGLACTRCHPDAASLQALRNTPQACIGCHAKNDKHQGKFGRQCGQCHGTDGWAGAKFDHTIFPLDHGSQERRATCQTCHPNDVGTYTCYGCHAHTPATVQGQHEGRALADLTDCIRCHPGGRKEGGD